jgi:hypothetical protein
VKRFAFVAVGLAVVVGLWFLFKPEPPAPAPVATPPPAAMAAPAPAREQVFELTVSAGKLVAGPEVLQVRQGERVILNVRSDRPDELHLHGYDLHAHVGPGQPASIRFSADRSGRFGLELHGAHAELGALEVYPR